MRKTPKAMIPPLMLFAAGFGTRMGTLTAHQPKPLVQVAGRALIEHALDLVAQAGVTDVVVNLHYLGEQLHQHLMGRGVTFSWEREIILETGGGLRAALPLLQGNPVLTLNPDVVWTGENPLSRLITSWQDDRMDALLMLLPTADAQKTQGDFSMDQDGRITRGHGGEGFVYLGAQLLRTDLLAQMPNGAFSLNLLWDRLIADGRAFGVVHDGGWCDVGHPAGIGQAEALLRDTHV